MERIKSKTGGGGYFAAPKSDLRFIGSGCTLLDLVVCGGWPLGRMVNIIGDKSTGKTLLAIEACANFNNTYPKGKIWYRETEAAFDKNYAKALGMPIDKVDFGPGRFDTIEDIFEDLTRQIDKASKANQPGLYIIDSLDALSSRAELARKMGEGTYGLEKQKLLGELFRKLVRKLEDTEICLIIVSQVRAKIGAMFGDKTTRSGGAALDFYASQAIKLSHLKNLSATISGVKRVTGLRIKVKCVKNKIGQAQRECEFVIRFGYGVESLQASLEWLMSVNRLKDAGIAKDGVKDFLAESDDWSADEYESRVAEIDRIVRRVWREIETSFLPTRRKYG